MRMKVFVASSMAAANRDIRAELGPMALIISSETDKKTGSVRVTAAIEDNDVTTLSFQDHLFAQEDLSTAAIETLLRRHGLSERLLVTLTMSLEAASGFSADQGFISNPLGAALNESLKFTPTLGSKPWLFVGPPGGGKSVTLMKLAAEVHCATSSFKVATADTLKTGAWDQLQGLARYLDHDVVFLSQSKPSNKTLKGFTSLPANDSSTILLVDTPGCNPFDPDAIAHIAQLQESLDAETILVLPAGLDPQETLDMIAAYTPLSPKAFIATKLDVSQKFGNLVMAAQTLPALGYTASPNIGFPIVPLDGETLSALLTDPRLAFRLNEDYSSLEDHASLGRSQPLPPFDDTVFQQEVI